jgi:hypothetical protein
MIGLKKTKARQGEISQSARALTLDDMHRLHNYCMTRPGLDDAERRRGIVRYVRALAFVASEMLTDGGAGDSVGKDHFPLCMAPCAPGGGGFEPHI